MFQRFLATGLPTGATPGMRSVDWVAEGLGLPADEVQKIADDWLWQERADAHDVFLLDAIDQLTLDQVEQIHRRAGATLRLVAMREITKLERASRTRESRLRDWTGTDLARMLTTAIEIEKTSRGAASNPLDLSALDDDTLDKIKAAYGQ